MSPHFLSRSATGINFHWLTVDGCPNGYIPKAGDSLLFDTPQPLAIHALSPSVYAVS